MNSKDNQTIESPNKKASTSSKVELQLKEKFDITKSQEEENEPSQNQNILIW